jgi:hypothetical protein
MRDEPSPSGFTLHPRAFFILHPIVNPNPMAYYITFLNKETKEPVSLGEVDALICKHFNVTVHPERFGGAIGFYDWYNVTAFYLAQYRTNGPIDGPIDSEIVAFVAKHLFELFDKPDDVINLMIQLEALNVLRFNYDVRTTFK